MFEETHAEFKNCIYQNYMCLVTQTVCTVIVFGETEYMIVSLVGGDVSSGYKLKLHNKYNTNKDFLILSSVN